MDWENDASADFNSTDCFYYLIEPYNYRFDSVNIMYGCAWENTIAVGHSIALMIKTFNINPKNVHCIGHSLGGKIF